MTGRRFDEMSKKHRSALSLDMQLAVAGEALDTVGEGYYETWNPSVRVAALKSMARLQEQIEALREQLNRPVEETLQGQCLTPMDHVSGETWPCVLPALHRRFDEPHMDEHGHYAPLLVHWSTIEEVRRVQEARDRGEIT
jgi:hypothetical protein